MSGKLSKNRKRPIPTSTFKTKRLKLPDCKKNDASEDESSNEKMTGKKLVTLSQPTLRSDLKIKLHSLLSNWKPPLKNTRNENHENCVTTDSTQTESEVKLMICDDTVSDSNQLQTISPTNSTNFISQAESSLNNDKYNVNKYLEQEFLNPHQGTDNAQEPSTSLNEVSESSTGETYKTVDFKEQIRKDILMHETQACEVIMKDKNCDTKSLEDSPSEQVNSPNSKARTGFTTPEVTRTPPTPPTLKVSWLNSNGYNTPCNSIHNEDCKEPSNLNTASSNEQNACNEEKLVLETSTNDELLTSTKELELETLIEHTVDNSFQSECGLDVNTLHSQLNSIERNLSSVTQRDLAQEMNPPRGETQELQNIDFTPFHPTSLVPKMPNINWVRQLRDDKRNLQNIVREISQLNAMMTRAVRELWSERKQL